MYILEYESTTSMGVDGSVFMSKDLTPENVRTNMATVLGNYYFFIPEDQSIFSYPIIPPTKENPHPAWITMIGKEKGNPLLGNGLSLVSRPACKNYEASEKVLDTPVIGSRLIVGFKDYYLLTSSITNIIEVPE
tara:strand:+ start:1304 stop:1705 length:402 start_codon:yes stop_codon:yes gene_type:complete